MRRMTAAFVAVFLAWLLLEGASRESTGQAQTAVNSPREPYLMRDLDEAIRLVEKNEFKTFLERYAPVEVLRNLRQKDLVDQAATVMAEEVQTKYRLLIVLNALKKQTPRFDKTRGLATLDFDPTATNAAELHVDLRLPDPEGVKLAGLGGDPARVIAEAIRLLEAGDVATFAQKLFPATELARLNNESQMQTLVRQFQDQPELAKAMIANFKRMQSVKPELADGGQTAVFVLKAEPGVVPRTIKLQKVRGDWRLFDDSPRVSKEIRRQSQLKPGSSVTPVQLELIGGNWRFIEIPLFRLE